MEGSLGDFYDIIEHPSLFSSIRAIQAIYSIDCKDLKDLTAA
jgi:hypothetical protein